MIIFIERRGDAPKFVEHASVWLYSNDLTVILMPGEVIWPVGGLLGQTLLSSSFGLIPLLFLEHGDYSGCPVCMGSASMILGPWLSLVASAALSKPLYIISNNYPTSFMHEIGILCITALSWLTIVSEMPTGVRLRRNLTSTDYIVLFYMFATVAFQLYHLVY